MKFLPQLFFLLLYLLQYNSIWANNENRPDVLQLVAELNTAKQDTSKVRILNELAVEFIGVDNKKALDYSHQAQFLAEELNYDKGLSLAYYNIAKSFYYQYEFDSIMVYYEKSSEVNSKKIKV